MLLLLTKHRNHGKEGSISDTVSQINRRLKQHSKTQDEQCNREFHTWREGEGKVHCTENNEPHFGG